MNDFQFIKSRYLKLRGSTIKLLDRFDEDTYFYQPTPVSNATAWIIPHISAFEKIMVTDRIDGYKFPRFISDEDVEKYKPNVKGFACKKGDMMGMDEAVALLENTRDVSIAFLDVMISDPPKDVDSQVAAEKYILNFSHETEHLGQLKYLLGTWTRQNK